MTKSVLPRFLTSVSAKLLLIIFMVGMGINLAIIWFVGAFQYHAAGAFNDHLTRYVDYLVAELGSPPDRQRAEQLAGASGMVIAYRSPAEQWSTGGWPLAFSGRRSRLHYDDGRIRIESSHGSHAALVTLPAGQVGFYLSRQSAAEEKIRRLGLQLLLLISLLLLLSFLAIRWVLRPLKWLKDGVDTLSRGHLSHRVPLKRRDELSDLAQAFNTMADRLGHLIKTREQLLLDVSHELRTPITRIKVALALLPGDEGKAEISEDLNEIEDKINELLETARSLEVKAKLKLSPVDIGSLIAQVADLYRHHPPGVVVKPIPPCQTVLADREQLAKALKNIIDNAVTYSQVESAPVEVSAAILDEDLIIEVEDFGMGIPAADLAFIFEPFYRVDKVRSPKSGYGLGLSLVKSIIEAHNGKVAIESKLGQGTLVRICLPGCTFASGQ